MTTEPTVTTDQAAATSAVPSLRSPHTRLSPRRPWLLGALLLAGAAQLITISALLSVDPLAVNWWSLLLAIAPAPVAAVAAFAPATLARAATAAAIVILVVGIVAGILHTGLFFLPALVVLVIGGRSLLREQP
jgi:hypothetical protein